jgi:hypothetical protein
MGTWRRAGVRCRGPEPPGRRSEVACASASRQKLVRDAARARLPREIYLDRLLFVGPGRVVDVRRNATVAAVSQPAGKRGA